MGGGRGTFLVTTWFNLGEIHTHTHTHTHKHTHGLPHSVCLLLLILAVYDHDLFLLQRQKTSVFII